MDPRCMKCPTGNGYDEDACFACEVWLEKKMLNDAGRYPCPKCGVELDAFVDYIPEPTVIYRCHGCNEYFGEGDFSTVEKV